MPPDLKPLRIIHEPEVYLIGRPCFDDAEMAHALQDLEVGPALMFDANSPEKLVEMAGRVCYMSYGKGRKTNAEFIKNLIASGHHSVLEHATWTLLITGVSRSLSHEFVRHRHFSYSQLSQRYVDSSDAAFVEPREIRDDAGLHALWTEAVEAVQAVYEAIEAGIAAKYRYDTGLSATIRTKLARQVARSILPNATETRFVVTGNARAWRHFFDMRGTIHADTEIRKLAVKILEILKPEAPTIFADYDIRDGFIVNTGGGGGDAAG